MPKLNNKTLNIAVSQKFVSDYGFINIVTSSAFEAMGLSDYEIENWERAILGSFIEYYTYKKDNIDNGFENMQRILASDLSRADVGTVACVNGQLINA